MSQVTYQSWVVIASKQLADISDSAKLDARLLLSHGLAISQSKYMAWPDTLIPDDSLPLLDDLLQQRMAGRPIAYILGQVEFWGLELTVSEAVLVPRPETETLVEACLEKLACSKQNALELLDLGTGSGAIALALASELPDALVMGVDASRDALRLAKDNARQLGIRNITFLESNWYSELPSGKHFDVIVSNPPYVAENDPHLEKLTYEPDMALTAANDGMADIQHIIKHAQGHLRPAGYLLIEHGFEQAGLVRDEFNQFGFEAIETIQDLAGNDRVTLGRMQSG